MAQLRNFKVITKSVRMEEHEFVLVRFNITGLSEYDKSCSWIHETMYGTVDRDLLDENGRTNRPLCLADLWAGETIPEALKRREDYFNTKRMIEELKAQGARI